jgi:hypothetical protein
MPDQSDFGTASQFAASNEVDERGEDILNLLHSAEAERRRALDTEQKLSRQLQLAENRIEELEAEVRLYKAKIENAKLWLRKLFSQIEERLLG